MKKRNKAKAITIAILLVIILITSYFIYALILNPKSLQGKYGNRLDNFNNKEIVELKLKDIEEKYKEDENIIEIKNVLEGKIINFLIKSNEKGTEEKMKDLFSEILEEFTEEEKKYLSFGFFVNNNDLGYKLMGTKNSVSENLNFASISEGEKNE